MNIQNDKYYVLYELYIIKWIYKMINTMYCMNCILWNEYIKL